MDKKEELQIELNDDVAGGVFSNLALINHSSTEFIVDFIQMMPAVPKAKVKSRIILTPLHAKKLLKALADNIEKYESNFETIEDLDSKNNIPISFGNTAGEA